MIDVGTDQVVDALRDEKVEIDGSTEKMNMTLIENDVKMISNACDGFCSNDHVLCLKTEAGIQHHPVAVFQVMRHEKRKKERKRGKGGGQTLRLGA